MSLGTSYPKAGSLLICDFERGFIEPEMVKARPVVVVSRNELHGRRLCTVVPLSTTAPATVFDWHIPLADNPLPEALGYKQVWAKCDMVYTVSFDRLDRPHRKHKGKREYLSLRIDRAELNRILAGVISHLSSIHE